MVNSLAVGWSNGVGAMTFNFKGLLPPLSNRNGCEANLYCGSNVKNFNFYCTIFFFIFVNVILAHIAFLFVLHDELDQLYA